MHRPYHHHRYQPPATAGGTDTDHAIALNGPSGFPDGRRAAGGTDTDHAVALGQCRAVPWRTSRSTSLSGPIAMCAAEPNRMKRCGTERARPLCIENLSPFDRFLQPGNRRLDSLQYILCTAGRSSLLIIGCKPSPPSIGRKELSTQSGQGTCYDPERLQRIFRFLIDGRGTHA